MSFSSTLTRTRRLSDTPTVRKAAETPFANIGVQRENDASCRRNERCVSQGRARSLERACGIRHRQFQTLDPKRIRIGLGIGSQVGQIDLSTRNGQLGLTQFRLVSPGQQVGQPGFGVGEARER